MDAKRNTRSRGQTGSVLMIGLLVMVILSFLGLAVMTLSLTEHNMAYNSVWAEGAFAAAEAGVNVGISQLSANTTAAAQPVSCSTAVFGSCATYSFRSGGKTDTTAQQLQFVQSRTEAGYSITIGTGYNPSGYAFNVYRINATGTGPRSALREVEVQAEYGPVAQ
jgi:Tfp pilus assembly protein PilX